MQDQNRRTFARSIGIAAAGSLLNLNPHAIGANEKVTLALVGAHNQGRGVANRSIRAGAVVKTICDLDDDVIGKVAPEIERAQDRRPGSVREFQRVLDDKDIDAVILAVPDHWHTRMAILACQAGKDVYVEKPLSQTIQEGQWIRDAARQYNRVMQVGTHRRSAEHVRTAAEYVASGKLGKICLVKAWNNQVRTSIGKPPDGSPPATADYDLWLGPAPKRQFNPNRFHYNWRFFWDYGNSEIGNQGVHAFDMALACIQKMRGDIQDCMPSRISSMGGIYWLDDAKEVPDTETVHYDFGDFMLVYELRSFAKHRAIEGVAHGVAFYGTEATLVMGEDWTVYPKDGGLGLSFKGTPATHERNFLECVKSRKRPNSDVEIGRLSTTMCHLGNISYHLKRDIRFDPKTETFGDDQEANSYLTKSYRSPYEPPKV
jgi:predicted dehydrogenase